MKFYDILFLLDAEQHLNQVEWGNSKTEATYHLLFSNWIAGRASLSSVFPLTDDDWSGELFWDEDHFLYEKKMAPNDCYYLFLKKRDDKEYLFTKAFDRIFEGIQIYDKNACAVFFNKSSRAISQIPDDVSIEGRHLLDMYDLEEEISTTLTCLHTGSPVINRVDHYKSNDGIAIATANTSYPIKRGNELIGAVVFEQTGDIVKSYMRKMEEIDRALKLFDAHTKQIRFSGYTFNNIIGHGEKLQHAVSIAKKIAPQDSSVLLVGETGTGKEIFAQSIHRESNRSNKKFVALNCAAIPDSLIESILFGTQKGSFTGSENKPGYFEEAEGGTLFLDELNSMSLNMQSKILRAIQENTFRRVGGQKDIPMNVRIISSCNEDPFKAIGENQFRKDLFYRLSTVMIELPPLREHKEDLNELIRYHLNATSFQYVHPFTGIDPEVMAIFNRYDWSGNIRELFHVLDYAQNVSDGDILCPEHLPSYLTKMLPAKKEETSHQKQNVSIDFVNDDLQSLMDEYEHEILIKALDHYGYNISKTADALGIRRQSLQYRIKKYGIMI
ncbi:MAG: sigma 54-interacting transcriptional regulator [Clostridium sp.]